MEEMKNRADVESAQGENYRAEI